MIRVNYSDKDQRYWIDASNVTVWFDWPSQAQSAAKQAEIDEAVRAKVNDICDWLRGNDDPQHHDWLDIADAIETLFSP